MAPSTPPYLMLFHSIVLCFCITCLFPGSLVPCKISTGSRSLFNAQPCSHIWDTIMRPASPMLAIVQDLLKWILRIIWRHQLTSKCSVFRLFVTSCFSNIVLILIHSFIHSFSSLSYDRSKASSKASSPHSVIQSFLLQMRVSSPFLNP